MPGFGPDAVFLVVLAENRATRLEMGWSVPELPLLKRL